MTQPTPEELGLTKTCDDCGEYIDPELCWCGDFIKDHRSSGGCLAIPMGCKCHYEGRKMSDELELDRCLTESFIIKDRMIDVRHDGKSSFPASATWCFKHDRWISYCAFEWQQRAIKARLRARDLEKSCADMLEILESSYKTLDLRSGAQNPVLVDARKLLSRRPACPKCGSTSQNVTCSVCLTGCSCGATVHDRRHRPGCVLERQPETAASREGLCKCKARVDVNGVCTHCGLPTQN